MRSPFKFLDAYTREDKGIFFGRTEEVDALQEMVAKNRLALIYGPSGAGKTSLVQCGLANRYHPTDWYPLFIRRNEDINRSLEEALANGLEEQPPGDKTSDEGLWIHVANSFNNSRNDALLQKLILHAVTQ